jgi:hypothetical protein
VLLEFYKYPAEHWIHLRTTKPRTKVTKGPGSRAAAIAMAHKLIDAARRRPGGRHRRQPDLEPLAQRPAGVLLDGR